MDLGFISDLLKARDIYKSVRNEAGGDPREAYNLTESARAGRNVPSMSGLTPEMMAAVNRIADTSDVKGGGPFNAIALPIYEGLKGIEQNTAFKPISMLADLGVPRVTKPNEKTTDASLLNAASSFLGPLLGNF